MNAKKDRSANYSDGDRSLLIRLANAYKEIIECKKTDARTWRDKLSCWDKIAKKFNSATTGQPRTSKQLKEKYKAIKKGIKKQHSEHMYYTKGTGGGPYIPPPPPASDEEKILTETIKLSVEGFSNKFDSDGIQGISGLEIDYISDSGMGQAEEIENDWSKPTSILWQTPKHTLLNVKRKKNDMFIADLQDSFSMEKDNETPSNSTAIKEPKKLLNVCFPETWTARRRPILPKKKSISSAGAKFEVVAERKLELIELQKKAAMEKMAQEKAEHEARMDILNRKKEILLAGTLTFEF